MKLLITLLVSLPLWGAGPLPAVDESSYPKLVAENKGKVLLVDFWATWCKPRREELPELVKLEAKLKARGFRLVTVSADDPEKEAAARAFLAQSGFNGLAYLKQAKDDDRFINFIDPQWSGALPALFLYDRAGKKLKSFVGETKMEDVAAAVNRAL